METGVFFTTYRADMALRRRPLEKVRLALFALAAVVFPFVATPYWLNLANQVSIATVGALGLNLLVGYTGQISLGQGAFMAIGAYSAGILTARFGVPFWLGIPLASLVTAAAGLLFGLPSLRLKGLYLAIATLAAQQIVEWLITHWTALTGGTEALVVPAPRLFDVRLNTDFNMYWILLAAAAATALVIANLMRSRVGRAFVAIRDQDVAAAAIGVNVFGYKLLAFATSSFIVGMAGALLAYYRSIVTWERFTIEVSISYLAMISNVGRALQGTAPEIAALLPYAQQGAFGLVIILFLILEPAGLARLWRNVKDYFHVWPFAY